jgi:hypothetical protein
METKFGPKVRLKVQPESGGELTIWVPANNKFVPQLQAGVAITVDNTDPTKPKLAGIAEAGTGVYQPHAIDSPPAYTPAPKPTASQILLTWEAIYDAVETRHPMLADELTIKVVTTIFIACMDKGAIAPAKEA